MQGKSHRMRTKFLPCCVPKMLLCSQKGTIQCIWHMFKDKHVKSFCLFPSILLKTLKSSKVTVSIFWKFSLEFFVSTTANLRKLSWGGGTEARILYSQRCLQFKIRKFTESILLKLLINNKYYPKYSPRSTGCAV